MERLTERGKDGKYFVRISGDSDLILGAEERLLPGLEKWTGWWEHTVLGNIVDRLAAYEDTGLAPEEIQIQKEAMESMGWFGKMFQRYKGDPRGPIGTLGTALGKSLALLIVESAKNRQPVKDVDGNTWLPMLLDEFESMADVIEHGQEWIPVKVRLPMPYENPVLVYDNSGVGMAWYSLKMGWVYRTGLGCVDVTHWMPLPSPPKEEAYEK